MKLSRLFDVRTSPSRDQSLIVILILNAFLFFSGCSTSSNLENQNHASTSKIDQSSFSNTYVDTQFGIQTEIGDLILSQAQYWEGAQLSEADEFAQPRMCAHNVSHVLEMSGFETYSDYLIPNILDAVDVRGGLVKELDTRDKNGFIQSLNRLFDGHLPVGALINGCLYRGCEGEGGDGHIAILGHTDEDGIVYLYHNNWYRPDNEEGLRKAHMVSKEYYDHHGLRRQWMATPWIRVYRDTETDQIVDIENLLPALDDLDPYSGFFITVSIIPELLRELNALSSKDLFCPKGLTADAMLGACVTGDEPTDDVYGRFSDTMVNQCIERGLGRVCSTPHILETDRYSVSMLRWSRSVYELLRGEGVCPEGLYLNHEVGYCVQPGNEEMGTSPEIFGPFDTELVEDCFRWGGGNACASGRWSLSFFQKLQNVQWIP
jgi:hypothetical protein